MSDLGVAIAKEEHLKRLLAGYGSIAVAYSGGVDSTYLADVAHEVLGERAHMLIADTPSIPRSELAEAQALAAQRGWRLEVIQPNEFDQQEFLKNDSNRCYYCKGTLFSTMKEYASEHNIAVLAYGETAEDTFDTTRVGHVAAAEHAVVAPLKEAGMKKDEIRLLSRQRQLPTAEKASFACLASRFPTGTPLSAEAVGRVERVEEALRTLGFHQYRARHHGDVCRIEVDLAELEKTVLPEVREALIREALAAGYRHVAVDLAGYRTGSAYRPTV